MDLIVGGMGQGKEQIAMERFGLAPEVTLDLAGSSLTPELLLEFLAGEEGRQIHCLNHLHCLLRQHWDRKTDWQDWCMHLAERQPALVILLDEVGSGIIQMEAEARRYRELVGRVGCMLAAQADTVVRVVCGIGVQIK